MKKSKKTDKSNSMLFYMYSLYQYLPGLLLLLLSSSHFSVNAQAQSKLNILPNIITYYEPDDVALQAMQSEDKVVEERDYWYFRPLLRNNMDNQTDVVEEEGGEQQQEEQEDTAIAIKRVGFIFYTGGFVEPRSYAPILQQISEYGYPTYLLKAPILDLAIFSPYAASRIINNDCQKLEYEIDAWVVGGHSLGGVAAGMYAERYPVDGLVLLSSYPSSDMSSSSSSSILHVLSIWGNLDGLITREEWKDSDSLLPPESTTFIEIEGGNHAQMGSYGEQEGDNKATITGDEQQSIVVTEIVELMDTIAQKYDNELSEEELEGIDEEDGENRRVLARKQKWLRSVNIK